MSIENEIIDYLIRNRISTTEVADCLGKSGAVEGVKAVNRGHYAAGKVKWIYAYGESNWTVHEQISNIEENSIVLFEAFDCGERAIFGELVSKYLLLYCQCKALVVMGNIRDAAGLIRENYPIWAYGFNPVGCFNRKPSTEYSINTIKTHRKKYDDTLAVCDDCGVVLIPRQCVNQEFLQKLKKIEEQEDIWFDRLDHYKESTFEIVCKQRYLQDEAYMRRKK